ncbi:MAG: hypothetical protein PUK34_04230, partial [Clostridia bacterium]|nr:hypothetical protein [Clostridia bacterium]
PCQPAGHRQWHATAPKLFYHSCFNPLFKKISPDYYIIFSRKTQILFETSGMIGMIAGSALTIHSLAE